MQQFTTEQQNEHRYEVTVTPPKAHATDAYEIADITIQDHYSGKLYERSIWCDDETFDSAKDNELGATYIWFRTMEDPIVIDNIKIGQLKEIIDDDIEPINISNFFGKEDGQLIEQAILRHHTNNESYEIKASNVEFLTNIVPHYVAHHEIGEIAIKANEKTLSKKDILNFAKVLDNPKLDLNNCALDYLEQPFTRIFNRDQVNRKPKEFASFKSVFEKLNLNTKKLGKLKGMELER
jgi:hypothetical protein